MATKTELENLIDVNLADESNIIAIKHREVEKAFVNELYPDTIVDTHNTPVNIFQAVQPNMEYRLDVRKQGNIVFVVGFIKNTTNIPINGTILSIVDSNFIPSSFAGFRAQTQSISGFSVLYSILTNGNIVNISGASIVGGSTWYFSFFYFVNS